MQNPKRKNLDLNPKDNFIHHESIVGKNSELSDAFLTDKRVENLIGGLIRHSEVEYLMRNFNKSEFLAYRKFEKVDNQFGSNNNLYIESVEDLLFKNSLNSEAFLSKHFESKKILNSKNLPKTFSNMTTRPVNLSNKSNSANDLISSKCDISRQLQPNLPFSLQKENFSVSDFDLCNCVNPGTSHACSSMLTHSDSFGIFNPVYEDTDPDDFASNIRSKVKQNLKSHNNSSETSRTKGKMKSTSTSKRSNSISKPSRTSKSNCESLESISKSSTKSSYSDIFTIFSPTDGAPNDPLLYPSDLQAELLFPLSSRVEGNVLKNSNAKEATFFMEIPKSKSKRKDLKLYIPPPVHDAVKEDQKSYFTHDEDREDKTCSSVSKMKSSDTSVSSIKSESNTMPHKFGDIYDRNEYLEYKSSQNLLVDSKTSENNDKCLLSDCEVSLTDKNFSRRLSFNPQDKRDPKTKRKTSLPNSLDISSIFESDLTSSLKHIYHPLPEEIFHLEHNRTNSKISNEYDNLYFESENETNSNHLSLKPKSELIHTEKNNKEITSEKNYKEINECSKISFFTNQKQNELKASKEKIRNSKTDFNNKEKSNERTSSNTKLEAKPEEINPSCSESREQRKAITESDEEEDDKSFQR